MTREQCQTEREAFNAFCDGKEIQSQSVRMSDGCALSEWIDDSDPQFTAIRRHRLKPQPKMVPLEPEDVPPGSVLRWHTWLPCYYRMPLEVTSCGVMLLVGGVIEQLSFESLIEGYEISRDGGKTWQRAEKEETK